MATIQAESLAAEVLRDYLLRKLPAKLETLNAARFAAIQATRPGPYTVVGDIELGADVDSELPVPLTVGVRTATQVAADINAAAVPDLLASVDRFDRLVVSATAAPTTQGSKSVVSLGPAQTEGANRAFGWGDGGFYRVRSHLLAPSFDDVFNGTPDVTWLGQGPMQVVLGKRSTSPAPNIRRSIHVVSIATSILVCEPNANDEASREYIEMALRSVREVLAEDRTLDLQVQKVEWPQAVVNPRSFRFQTSQGSGLTTEAQLTLNLHVFERA